MKPPRIINAQPQHHREVVIQAAHNIRMGRTALELALYYAAQRTGFRPSIKNIMETLRKTSCQVKTARSELAVHHFIKLSPETLEVDWVAISALALADCRFKKSDYTDSSLWMDEPPEEPIYKMLNRMEKEIGCHYTKKDSLTSFTPGQYLEIVKAFPESRNVRFPENTEPWVLERIRMEPEEIRWTTKEVFEAPDPHWVMQEPVYDKTGSMTGFAHYRTALPF